MRKKSFKDRRKTPVRLVSTRVVYHACRANKSWKIRQQKRENFRRLSAAGLINAKNRKGNITLRERKAHEM
jgi:hypothetical protein